MRTIGFQAQSWTQLSDTCPLHQHCHHQIAEIVMMILMMITIIVIMIMTVTTRVFQKKTIFWPLYLIISSPSTSSLSCDENYWIWSSKLNSAVRYLPSTSTLSSSDCRYSDGDPDDDDHHCHHDHDSDHYNTTTKLLLMNPKICKASSGIFNLMILLKEMFSSFWSFQRL